MNKQFYESYNFHKNLEYLAKRSLQDKTIFNDLSFK